MKRYAAFDPPEYLAWDPEPELIDEFNRTISLDAEREAVIKGLTEEDFLSIYRDLLLTRIHDIGLKRWVRTGVISKAVSYTHLTLPTIYYV